MRICSGPRTTRFAIAMLVMATTIAGCGYSLRAPYNREVQTIYVPVFKSVRFRRDINLQLTELVIKEIERRAGYKVVGTPEGADIELHGTIVFDDKLIWVENPNNFPRQLLSSMNISVALIDNRRGFRKKIGPINVGENSSFYPELGETAQLGFYKTMEKISADLVNMMEEPWGPEYQVKEDDLARDDDKDDDGDSTSLRSPARRTR